jgi:multidrug efflux pump
MISRFFIDRPIFATVLSVVILLTGLITLVSLPIAQYPRVVPPAVVVSISYPGANAQVVSETVAAPIEQQVNGVEGMLYMSSQSGNDGTYSLTVTFDLGTDLNTALVMVQNRVALAMQQLPTSVQNQGITIRKKTPDILMIVNFYSDGRYDDIYLSNYATINVKDELLRVDGVSDVTYLGQRDYSIRCWLDPQKLAAMSMTAIDVSNAIRNQNLDAPAGQLGQPPSSTTQAFQLPIDTLGRLTTPEQFGNIIVKASASATVAARPTVMAPARGRMPSPAPSAGPAAPDAYSPDGGAAGGTSTTMSAAQNALGTTISTSMASLGTTQNSNIATSGVNAGGGGSTGGGASSGGGGTTGGGGMTGAAAAGGGMTVPSIAGAGATTRSYASNPRGPSASSAAIVRLQDVARVELGAQNYNQACTFDGQPSVGLSIYQFPGTNALDVSNRVHDKMEELKKRFPAGLKYDIAYDTTPFISESILDVGKTFLEAVALVGMVVLLFLQDWKAMILPMIDVPVSIIGTFAVMAMLGFSLNNISLFGLVLAIGIVVDDAIVVLENIERQMAKGFDARTATIRAMDEVTGPIIAVGLVLCAVFVPCAMLSGITGQFFRQFGVTIAVSTVISAINAITMTPSRAVLIFKAQEGRHAAAHEREALPWWFFAVAMGVLFFLAGPGVVATTRQLLPFLPRMHLPSWLGGLGSAWPKSLSWAVEAAFWFIPGAVVGGAFGWYAIKPVNYALGAFFRGFNYCFDAITAAYGWTIGMAVRLSLIVLLGYAGLLFLTYVVFTQAPTGFIPQQDQGRLIVNVQLPDSSSLERTRAAAAQVEKIARDDPGVAHTVTISGLSFLLQANSSNFASMFVVLKPFDERQEAGMRDTDIMNRLRKAWAKKVDAVVTVNPAAPIPGLGTAGGYKLIVEDRGGLGLNAMQEQTESLIGKIKLKPGLKNVSTQFRSRTPQLYLDIDRTKVASLGVSLDDVNQTLDMYLGSLYVNSFNDFGRHWQVTVQAEGSFRETVEDINLFQVRNASGQMVSLGTLLTPKEVGGPISITRYNLYTSATIIGNIETGVSTGDAIATVDKLADSSLPLSMKSEWTEIMFMQIRAEQNAPALYVFALAVLAVFLTLSGLYESWWLPLAVILVVPLCLLCSVIGVRTTNRDVNIFVQIGLVVLVALACKNAILIVEFAKQMHVEGRSLRDSTVEASRLRLRPILMTSFAFIFGVIPLVIASGAGAEMRRSLGTAVFSGMLGVTIFGIFLTPVFFYVIQGFGEVRLFAVHPVVTWIASCVFGAALGLACGHLLTVVHIVRSPWGLALGPLGGVLAVLTGLGVHQGIRSLSASNGDEKKPPP